MTMKSTFKSTATILFILLLGLSGQAKESPPFTQADMRTVAYLETLQALLDVWANLQLTCSEQGCTTEAQQEIGHRAMQKYSIAWASAQFLHTPELSPLGGFSDLRTQLSESQWQKLNRAAQSARNTLHQLQKQLTKEQNVAFEQEWKHLQHTMLPSTELRARTSLLKSNMHRLQTLVETYAVDWGGGYPTHLDMLYQEAKAKNYYVDIINPFTERYGLGKDGAALDYRTYSFYKHPHTDFRGTIIYIPTGNPITGYYLFGCGYSGQLIGNKGSAFYLRSDGDDSHSSHWSPQNPIGRILLGQSQPNDLESPQKLVLSDAAFAYGYLKTYDSLLNIWQLAHDRCGQQPASCQAETLDSMVYEQAQSAPESLAFFRYQVDLFPHLATVKQQLGTENWGQLTQMTKDLQDTVSQIKTTHFTNTYDKLKTQWSVIGTPLPSQSQVLSREKISSVKSNMHTLQMMVETYAVDWGGTYPENLGVLYEEASAKSYWKPFHNPFTNKEGIGKDGSLIDYPAYQLNSETLHRLKGLVLYLQENNTSYQIMGTDFDGKPILMKGKTFVLTNS